VCVRSVVFRGVCSGAVAGLMVGSRSGRQWRARLQVAVPVVARVLGSGFVRAYGAFPFREAPPP